MLNKLIGGLIISTLLLFGFLLTERTQANTELNYVKIEVKGKLIQEGAGYAVQTNDAKFNHTEMLIILERSEDKNRELDRYFNDLNGKIVIANGFLDCRRFSQEQGRIYLYFSSKSQISAAEGN